MKSIRLVRDLIRLNPICTLKKEILLCASGGMPPKPDKGGSALLLRRLPVPGQRQPEEAGLSRDLWDGGRGGGGRGTGSCHRSARPGYHHIQVLTAALPAGSALCRLGEAQAESHAVAV